LSTERQRLTAHLERLKKVRLTHEPGWKAIGEYVLPYRLRWYDAEFNKGKVRDPEHISSTPPRALRIFAAGMIAGVTSPSRIWFRLTTGDRELAEKHAVRAWLDSVERVMREVLAKSGFYLALAEGIYRDLGLIGNAAMIEEEMAGRLRFETFTIGEWWIDVNANGEVDTFFHQRPMTVKQLVDKFGQDNVGPKVRADYDAKRWGTVYDVVHAIYPNPEPREGALGPEGMPWLSAWWERTAPGNEFLRKGGYREFPVMVPRTSVPAGETYGRGSPGWEALGDCKSLQHRERALAMLVDKTAEPPMRAPKSLKGARASLLPADITYTADASQQKFEPAMKVEPQAINATLSDIQRHEVRVERAFFVDLWLALLSDPRSERPTAEEVRATRQEVMLQLGPLLEGLNNGLLEPVINRTYALLERMGRIPEAPQELIDAVGDDGIKVEFISIMHQAQKLTAMAGLQELIAAIQQLAATHPEVTDKLDADAIVDELADVLGVKPDIVRAEDKLRALRQARAEREQAAQTGEAMSVAARGVRDLGSADATNLEQVAGMVAPLAAGGLQ